MAVVTRCAISTANVLMVQLIWSQKLNTVHVGQWEHSKHIQKNKIKCVKKPWPLVCWLKGAFREHLKQFCQTQGIEIAWRSGGCNWLAGVAGAGKEQGAAGLCCRLGHSGWACVTNRVPQLCCCAELPKFPFLLLYWALWEGPAGGKELSPLPAPDYFGRAKLRLKWCPSKQGNFCLLYAYHSLSTYTWLYIPICLLAHPLSPVCSRWMPHYQIPLLASW